MTLRSAHLHLFLILFLLTTAMFAQNSPGKLQLSVPSGSRFQSSSLSALTTQLDDSIPSIGSFLIWRNGGLVYEHYFNGADSATAFNIKSITKSIVSALGGIAIEKGLLPSLKTPVVRFFPDFAKPRHKPSTVWFAEEKKYQDSVRSEQTLYHLLTMQHGWEWNDFAGPVNIFINAADPIRFTMDIPFVDTPGTKFIYSSAASSLFGAVLEKTVHTSLRSFAETNLLTPAGMRCTRWDTDPMGRTIGCSEMYLTARDLMRFGLLYLQKGRQGSKQIIPADWVVASVAQHATLDYWDILPGANGYGYYWWRRKSSGHQAYVASGAGGQIVTVIPDMNTVIVATCLLNQHNRGRSELKRLHEFVDKLTETF